MDLIKAKSILARLQAMIGTLDSHPQISALERDLILNYLRDLYDVFLDSSVPAFPVIRPKETAPASIQEKENLQKVLEFKFEHQEAPVDVEKSMSIVEKPAAEVEAPAPKMEPPTPKFEPPAPEPVVIASVPPKEETVSVTEAPSVQNKLISIPASIMELFDIKKGSELSDRLYDLPLRDINRAIGINDRMEIIHTLFGGQKQLFEQIITDLNNFKIFEEARDLLGQGPAIHYKWDHDDRKEKAVEFIRLIRRRYL